MGAILDSAKNIRQNQKDSPGQAHKAKAKLAQNKDKGLKMADEMTTLQTVPQMIEYNGGVEQFRGLVLIIETERKNGTVYRTFVRPESPYATDGVVPPEIRGEINHNLNQIGYTKPIYIKTLKL